MEDQGTESAQTRPIRVSVELPEKYECVGIGRRMARAVLEHCEAHTQDVDETEIIIGELCGNAARHARSESGWYCCTLEHHGDHVVVTVVDQGHGFDPESVAPIGTARQDDDGSERHGGFGLPLVKSLTDEVAFVHSDPQGLTVRAERRLLQTEDATPSICVE